MRGLIGLANSSLAPCQYRPLCPPSSLTSFWANCLGRLPGGRAKYCFCASTKSRHASMAASSFLPMRRNRISSLPAIVSKYHKPLFFTKGIGNGQFSAPMTRVTVLFGSVTNRCISWYLTTKLARVSESSTGSPEEMTSFPAGPRMLKQDSWSCPCIAANKALAASSAEAKVRCPGCWANVGANEHPKESANRATTASRTKHFHSSRTEFKFLCGMMFLSILEFSTSSNCVCMQSPMPSTAAVKTTATRATSKARPPARGKASDISTVIKTAERAGACSWLKVRSRRPVEPRSSTARSASVKCVAMVEVAAVEIATAAVKAVAIDDSSAVGDVGVVVVNHAMAVPVASPVMPAPTKSSEEAHPEADSKSNPSSGQENPRHGIPAWIGDDRVAIHQPGIISRHVDYLRVGRFDDDSVALRCYLLLFIAIQLAALLRLLTHRLDGIRHVLLLIGIGVAKRRS